MAVEKLLSKVEAVSAKHDEFLRLSSMLAAPERLASEEQLSKLESLSAKQNEVVRLSMLAMTEKVLSAGELTSAGDPEWKAIAARGEAFGLELLATAAGSVETSTRMAVEFAARPGGEAVAEAHRRLVVCAAARRVRAEEFVAFMRKVGVLAESESDSAKRSRRPNARYFGPEWTN